MRTAAPKAASAIVVFERPGVFRLEGPFDDRFIAIASQLPRRLAPRVNNTPASSAVSSLEFVVKIARPVLEAQILYAKRCRQKNGDRPPAEFQRRHESTGLQACAR